MDDFQKMNEVYTRVIRPHKPARSAVSVKRITLDVLVEIDCIAEIFDKTGIP